MTIRSVIAAATLCILPVSAFADPVTWTFDETSCTSAGAAAPGDCSPPTPLDLADLTLPYDGAPAGADNLWIGAPEGITMKAIGTFIGTGWTLTIFNTPGGTVTLEPDTPPYLTGAIGLQGGFSGLNLDLFIWTTPFTQSEISNRLISSDLQIANCPLDLSCQITGFWQETPIPEPPTAVMLLAALALGLAVRRHGPVSAG